MDYYQRNMQYFMNQRYQRIKKLCIGTASSFEDQEFLPEANSLFLTRQDESVLWKRPKELSSNPHFVVDGVSSTNFSIGSCGSSSFVAACSMLSNYPDFWNRVVPDLPSQENVISVNSMEDLGIFRFRFWRFGKWFEVVVDDRLPTLGDKPFGVHSKDENEFWCPLLEKAYAKFVGCYEGIENLDAGLILQDFTGGILQHLQLTENASNLDWQYNFFNDLQDSKQKGRTMLTSWIKPREVGEEGSETAQGLIIGCMYAVTALKEIKLGTGLLKFFKSSKVRMIKLRNPVGSTQWRGSWSDRSDEWSLISESEKRKMGLTLDEVGEFWLSFSDFCSTFTDVSICGVVHSSVLVRHSWRESYSYGAWQWQTDPYSGADTAGETFLHSPEKYLQNAQYKIDVPDDSRKKLFIELQQSEPRLHASHDRTTLLEIGMHIAKVEENRSFKLRKLLEGGTDYPPVRNRNAFAELSLSKGRYVIIPYTLASEVSSKFLLRVYSQANVSFSELAWRYPDQTCWAFCFGYPKLVTRVRVAYGNNCIKLEGKVANPYVVIGCEGKTVRSKTFKENRNPSFDLFAIFYRKNPDALIVLTVYNDGLLCDSFMGQGTIAAGVDDTANSVEVPLFGRRKQEGVKYPGSLFVDIASSEDINEL
ncbi:calpain-5-like [Clavelina lepadiformis]|uniref:calpain-5-like n=1 Tax=Clavelina lepadiformis TaxID=159417 RepID=UPI0040418D14